MSTQQINQVNKKRRDTDKLSPATNCDLELAYADALLDQVDTAQQHIRDIQSDIALLQTMENALGLISENMARVRRLAREAQQSEATHTEISIASDEIRNLMMINILIAEDTEFDGHFLFKDNVLSMCSFASGKLTLTTAKIPEISGVETSDFQAILDSLDSVARTINRQYQRIGTVMRTLLDAYQQLRCEIDLLMTARTYRNAQ
jgi:flagellin-like hook-associated protein FlgL